MAAPTPAQKRNYRRVSQQGPGACSAPSSFFPADDATEELLQAI
jgi:hypothetical protein